MQNLYLYIILEALFSKASVMHFIGNLTNVLKFGKPTLLFPAPVVSIKQKSLIWILILRTQALKEAIKMKKLWK